MKQVILKTPILGDVARWAKKRFTQLRFRNSADYWEMRYAEGGTSGAGSYTKFAEFKAEVLNAFTKEHHVQSVIEWGSGDGNQLRFFQFPRYVGVDVSQTAVANCRARYKDDPTKTFKHVSEYAGEQAELALSLDVIYHLVEDGTFEQYMQNLFNSATRFVIIYASNDDTLESGSPHVRHRQFSKWVAAHAGQWKLLQHIPNRYPYKGDFNEGSFADFYIYAC